jgi:alpha-beta hydrolase superfamily lysophospholipase
VTHDPARAAAYDEDPLVFKNATARWFTETQRAQERALARAGALAMPLYVVCGTEDTVAKMSAMRRFHDLAGTTDKTWDERAGLRHETLNEPQGPDVAAAIAEWVLRHSK